MLFRSPPALAHVDGSSETGEQVSERWQMKAKQKINRSFIGVKISSKVFNCVFVGETREVSIENKMLIHTRLIWSTRRLISIYFLNMISTRVFASVDVVCAYTYVEQVR